LPHEGLGLASDHCFIAVSNTFCHGQKASQTLVAMI